MRDHLRAYPGKVLQYPRNLILQPPPPPLKKASNNSSGRLEQQRHFKSSLEEVWRERRTSKQRPKLSLKLVRRLSRLLSPGKDECGGQVGFDEEPVDVHIPTRSKSLDGERRYLSLSRKQILASLQEEEAFKVQTMLEPFTFQHSISGGSLSEDWDNNSNSEDERADTSSESSSESGSYRRERFSRCQLLQTIESQEDRGNQQLQQQQEQEVNEARREKETAVTEDHNDNRQPDHNDNNLPQDNNDNDRQLKCDNRQYTTDCDNQEVTDLVISQLELDDLAWVGTLGIGGFGRVELVTAGQNNNLTFALKKMKKIEIKDEKQQQHIINEKKIMLSCCSPFVVKLYRTFRDPRYLYMLMEPCLGGELWTILRDKKRFDDASSRFYTACVIKAFEYLHAKGIVYRDLKPENLLLDASGYVKLTDFGFSKKLEPGEKSWTFCGTPEYVAPEIITNKSHDHRADIWSVGILMYELLNGIPPFSKRNHTSSSQVYTDILKGMKAVSFPSYMSSTAVELIRQLCRLSPTQRPSLAVARRYMWFAGMDWQALEDRTMRPPFCPKIAGAADTSNFDNYVEEVTEPDQDFSEWDLLF